MGKDLLPKKSFIRELSKATQPRQSEVKRFDYKKDLTPKSVTKMNVERRIRENKAVPKAKETLVEACWKKRNEEK